MELLEWQEYTLLHWSTVQVNMCRSPSLYNDCFRILEEWNESLYHFRYEDIRKKTGCIKPCKYLKYTVSFVLHSHVDSPHYTFSVLVSSLSFRVAEPTRNFVANICSRLVFKGWRKWDTGRGREIDLLSCISGKAISCKRKGGQTIFDTSLIGGWIWRNTGPLFGILLHDVVGWTSKRFQHLESNRRTSCTKLLT